MFCPSGYFRTGMQGSLQPNWTVGMYRAPGEDASSHSRSRKGNPSAQSVRGKPRLCLPLHLSDPRAIPRWPQGPQRHGARGGLHLWEATSTLRGQLWSAQEEEAELFLLSFYPADRSPIHAQSPKRMIQQTCSFLTGETEKGIPGERRWRNSGKWPQSCLWDPGLTPWSTHPWLIPTNAKMLRDEHTACSPDRTVTTGWYTCGTHLSNTATASRI